MNEDRMHLTARRHRRLTRLLTGITLLRYKINGRAQLMGFAGVIDKSH